ncbi:hypothetical protein [Lacrimispora sp.]|uniref:hypothetical protein n=1 Tax=Lacrimispora sp. TaxID=2719234 RepID=UPI003992C855
MGYGAEYAARVESAKIRTKKADTYKDFALKCLLKYPDMSAAQLYDWVKERTCLETLDFQERCSRDYVKSIREEYDNKKPETSRQYENKLIGQKREERDKRKSLLEQEQLLQQLFQDDELVAPFLEHIHQKKPRYSAWSDQKAVCRLE